MRTIVKTYLLFLLVLVPLSISSAQDKAGTVTAIRGKANILRLEKVLEARVRDDILKVDTVETLKESRIKLLFNDDSLLALGENSRLIVKEYIESTKDKRGQSIYHLLDGKMRAIVGKTRFEVHTPTAVAAARGTYPIIWVEKIAGEFITGVIVIDDGRIGSGVDLRNIIETILGTVIVPPGYISYVREGQPPTDPVMVPPELLNLLIDQTGVEDTLEAILPLFPTYPFIIIEIPAVPPITDVQRKSILNINVDVR